MADETVFQALPSAIVQIDLLEIAFSTVEGNVAKYISTIDAIIDEDSSADFNASPNAAPITSTTLLYVRPEQLPTLECAQLQASYGVRMHGKVYAIQRAAIGKNQENGVIEHVELFVQQQSAMTVEESE